MLKEAVSNQIAVGVEILKLDPTLATSSTLFLERDTIGFTQHLGMMDHHQLVQMLCSHSKIREASNYQMSTGEIEVNYHLYRKMHSKF